MYGYFLQPLMFMQILVLDDYYDEAGSLFSQQLILSKELKSPFDIRYKTDYFPRSGPNANKAQAPRYLHTVDDDQDIVIKVYLHTPKTLLSNLYL
jgi:hypothetical protein